MGIGVNVRTVFSLLFAPILAEFGWGYRRSVLVRLSFHGSAEPTARAHDGSRRPERGDGARGGALLYVMIIAQGGLG
jgi:hypothetical protein